MASDHDPDPPSGHLREIQPTDLLTDFPFTPMDQETEPEDVLRPGLMFNDRFILDLDLDNLPPREFPLFRFLPYELRDSIWTFALQKNRYIRIRLNAEDLSCGFSCGRVSLRGFPVQPTYNFDGKPTSGQTYLVNVGPWDGVTSHHLPSPLLAVSHESRAIANKFYSLKLPAFNSFSVEPKILHLNPDWDHIHLVINCPGPVIKFLWDCRAYDERDGRGIKHLVLSPEVTHRLVHHDFWGFKNLPAPYKQAVGSLLGDLETITYRHVNLKYSTLFPARFEDPSDVPSSPLVPLYARTDEFTLLKRDPRRHARRALSRLTITGDPGGADRDYRDLMEHCHLASKSDAIESDASESDASESDASESATSEDAASESAASGDDASDSDASEDDASEDEDTPVPMAKVMHMICAQPKWTGDGDDYYGKWINDRGNLEEFLRVEAKRHKEAKNQAAVETLEQIEAGFLGDFWLGRHEPNSNDPNPMYSPPPAPEALLAPPKHTAKPPPVERVAGFWLLPTAAFRHERSISPTLNEYSIAEHEPELGVFSLPLVATSVGGHQGIPSNRFRIYYTLTGKKVDALPARRE